MQGNDDSFNIFISYISGILILILKERDPEISLDLKLKEQSITNSLSSNFSIRNLLLDLIISIVNIFPSNMISISIFICIPDIQFVTFVACLKNAYYCHILAILPDCKTFIIDNNEILKLFGLLTLLTPIDALQKYISICTDNAYLSYIHIIQQAHNINLIHYLQHENYFTQNNILQYIIPFHWNIDTQKLTIANFVYGVFSSIFKKSKIPGVLNEMTGELLHALECNNKSTTWYDICVYHLSQFMKTPNTIEIDLIDVNLIDEIYKCFLETAAHFLLENKQIIDHIWSNPIFWNIIPLDIGFFYYKENNEKNYI